MTNSVVGGVMLKNYEEPGSEPANFFCGVGVGLPVALQQGAMQWYLGSATHGVTPCKSDTRAGHPAPGSAPE